MVWPIIEPLVAGAFILRTGSRLVNVFAVLGRSAPSATLAFNERFGNFSEPEVGLEDSNPVSGPPSWCVLSDGFGGRNGVGVYLMATSSLDATDEADILVDMQSLGIDFRIQCLH